MAGPASDDRDDHLPGDAQTDDHQHWFGLLVPALTFLVGLVLGGALIYATSGGDASDPPDADSAEASDAPSSGSGGDTVVTLPAACEEASAGVSEAYALLREALGQVRDFRADDLAETLGELQDVDEATRPLVEECSEVSVSVSPTPTESDPGSEPAEPES